MKFNSVFALLFVCLLGSSMFFQMAEAGKKKKALAFLLGALLAKKPKILPLPLPLPLPIPIHKTSYVPYPEPYPVYIKSGGYGGGYGGYGG